MSTKKQSSQNASESKALFPVGTLPLHHAYVVVGDRAQALKSVEVALKERSTGEESVFTYETFQKEDALVLRERALLRSHQGIPRYFIVAALAWTREAQNALLKVLEEPVSDTHFFLIGPSEHEFLPTIRSRVQVVHIEQALRESALPLVSAKKFLTSTRGERLAYIAQFLKEFEESETSGPRRKAAVDFLSALEVLVREQGIQKNTHALVALLTAKSHLQNQGALVKMVLEHIALIV